MRYHPMVFTGESVRGIQALRKTMTRRVIIPQPPMGCRMISACGVWAWELDGMFVGETRCPYQVGERLWVKETWATYRANDGWSVSEIPNTATIFYKADGDNYAYIGKWRSSRFMPRWASRIDREITEVLAPERLQEITHEDILLEGWDAKTSKPFTDRTAGEDARDWFEQLCDSINAKRGYSWEDNPWVWPIRFEEVKCQ